MLDVKHGETWWQCRCSLPAGRAGRAGWQRRPSERARARSLVRRGEGGMAINAPMLAALLAAQGAHLQGDKPRRVAGRAAEPSAEGEDGEEEMALKPPAAPAKYLQVRRGSPFGGRVG